MVVSFLPRSAAGHTPGLSLAELTVEPTGRVLARFTFASAEPLHGTPLRDEDLRAFLLQGVEVSADGERCEATYEGSGALEGDGLALEAAYACPAGARAIGLTLYYLNQLGPDHREVARIVATGASAEALLTRERRALTLELPGLSTARARTGRTLVWLSAVFAAFMVGLLIWRWRATRGTRAPQGFLKSRPKRPPLP